MKTLSYLNRTKLPKALKVKGKMYRRHYSYLTSLAEAQHFIREARTQGYNGRIVLSRKNKVGVYLRKKR